MTVGLQALLSLLGGCMSDQVPRPEVAPCGEAPSIRFQGLKFLGVNSHGCEEYLAERDQAVLILIPEGEFRAGPEADCRVVLTAYLIDKFEVTNRQYSAFLAGSRRKPPAERRKDRGWDGETLPVTGVSWDDAKVYAEWCARRLPTEAEWEKAARGTDGRKYPWGGERWPKEYDRSNDPDNEPERVYPPKPVGTTRWDVSPYGIMDMGANPGEWCADEFTEDYYTAISGRRDPVITTPWGWQHVFRSDCMCNRRCCIHEAYTRTAGVPSPYNAGFRCAMSIPDSAWVRRWRKP
jgi:formylglycine-generating enzyme required for sulfatase activity